MVKIAIINRVQPRPSSFSNACSRGTSGTNPVGLKKKNDFMNKDTKLEKGRDFSLPILTARKRFCLISKYETYWGG